MASGSQRLSGIGSPPTYFCRSAASRLRDAVGGKRLPDGVWVAEIFGDKIPSYIFRFLSGKKKPQQVTLLGLSNKSLTMTYSHMGRPHTTIGDASFHF